MALFVIETDFGMALREARTEASAWKQAREEQGTAHLQRVRRATLEDLAHVYAMGGWIPEEYRPKCLPSPERSAERRRPQRPH